LSSYLPHSVSASMGLTSFISIHLLVWCTLENGVAAVLCASS